MDEIKCHSHKTTWGGKSISAYTFRKVIPEGSQDRHSRRSLEVGGANAEATDECCLLLTHGLLRLLSYSTQDHQFRGGTAHSELRPPTSTVNQENTHRANLVGKTFLD